MSQGHGGHGGQGGQGGHGGVCPASACPAGAGTTGETVQGDPAAKECLRRAFDKTSRWGVDFRGFAADLTLNNSGTEYKGKVKVTSPRETEVQLDGAPEAVQQWTQNQIAMLAVHRAPRTFEDADGKYPLTFAVEAGTHPLGRQILIHGDGMNSRYRIKDDRIQQISRSMGPMRFTINVQEAMKTADDRFLTTQYVVYYFSPDGKLAQAESFTDHPTLVDGVYLPCHRRVILTEEADVIVRLLQFKNHAWL